jgi:hypothetical protein
MNRVKNENNKVAPIIYNIIPAKTVDLTPQAPQVDKKKIIVVGDSNHNYYQNEMSKLRFVTDDTADGVQTELRRDSILPDEKYKYQFSLFSNNVIPCIDTARGDVFKLYKIFRTLIHCMQRRIPIDKKECELQLYDINKRYGLMFHILDELIAEAERFCRAKSSVNREKPKICFSKNISCVKYIADGIYKENKLLVAAYIKEIIISKTAANELLNYIETLYNMYYQENKANDKSFSAMKETIIQIIKHNYCTLHKYAIYNIDNYIKLLEIEAKKQYAQGIAMNIYNVFINNMQFHDSITRMSIALRGFSPIIEKPNY